MLMVPKGAVRLSVYQMSKDDQRLSCGIVTQETKIVFRSPTAMVYLFIQVQTPRTIVYKGHCENMVITPLRTR